MLNNSACHVVVILTVCISCAVLAMGSERARGSDSRVWTKQDVLSIIGRAKSSPPPIDPAERDEIAAERHLLKDSVDAAYPALFEIMDDEVFAIASDFVFDILADTKTNRDLFADAISNKIHAIAQDAEIMRSHGFAGGVVDSVTHDAVDALGRLGGEKATGALAWILNHSSDLNRLRAVRALAEIGTDGAYAAISEFASQHHIGESAGLEYSLLEARIVIELRDPRKHSAMRSQTNAAPAASVMESPNANGLDVSACGLGSSCGVVEPSASSMPQPHHFGGSEIWWRWLAFFAFVSVVAAFCVRQRHLSGLGRGSHVK